ncbi:hypothetical protein ACFVAF_04245 [Streptomyces sp. NPDC057596]|uniref:hypothetical protein n=1 Tax=Streptomyces sp. NPDC057596 TaxID=3346178 RepID=UPI0036D169C2
MYDDGKKLQMDPVDADGVAIPQWGAEQLANMTAAQVADATKRGHFNNYQLTPTTPAARPSASAPTEGMSRQEITAAFASGALDEFLGAGSGGLEPIRVGPNNVAVNLQIPMDSSTGRPVEQWGEADIAGLSRAELAAAANAGHLHLYQAGVRVDQVAADDFTSMTREELRQADRDGRLALLRAGLPVPTYGRQPAVPEPEGAAS